MSDNEVELPPQMKDMILLGYCPDCDTETDHLEDGDERRCMDCGLVNEYLDWDSYSGSYYWRKHS